ncbi:hypothetical protein BD779DRAFT_1684940 [Infundibulicybe gibba]|nr:hypothetical protein BD779DRAFT_1684940 [Infundibulicybe gibba]
MAWGGPEEQRKEQEEGNLDAKDWQLEARVVVDKAVDDTLLGNTPNMKKLKTVDMPPATIEPSAHMSEYDRYRLILNSDDGEGWEPELRAYLKDRSPRRLLSHANGYSQEANKMQPIAEQGLARAVRGDANDEVRLAKHITDTVRLNSDMIEEVYDYQDYAGLLSDDIAMVEWDKFADAVVLGII